MNPEIEHQHKTLRDYAAVIRRRKLVILAITFIGAALAGGLSATQEPVYTATASLRSVDLSDSYLRAGYPPRAAVPVAQSSAEIVETTTREAVMGVVRENLGIEESIKSLTARVTALGSAQSSLVMITAEDGTAAGAAALANEVADVAVQTANEEQREDFERQAQQIQDRADELNPEENPEDIRTYAQLLDQASRLQTLADIAEVQAVADRANEPAEPTSPQPVRSAILGGIVGLIIGLITSGLMESLDRRLRRPEQAHELLGLPILAVVADHAVGGVPITGVPAEEHVAAMDTFRRLRTNIGFLNETDPPTTILVTSPLPEEGKTTVSMGLALASAASGRRTLLVEADLHRPVHAARLGVARAPGLAEYLAGDAEPPQILQSKAFVDPTSATRLNGAEPQRAMLACITAGAPNAWSGEALGSPRFAEFLREVGEVYDLVVIDSGPLLAVAETLEMVPMADAIVLCLRLGQTTIDEARGGVEALSRLPDRPTGLVATDAGSDVGGYGYYAYAYAYTSREEGGSRSALSRLRGGSRD